MIAAGVPLTKALEMAGRNRSIGIPQRTIQELVHHLQEGHTFTDAMQLVSGQKRGMDVSLKRFNKAYWLTEFDMALLSAGEESGRLDTVFKVLARYYAARAKAIHDAIGGSIITIVTLHVALLVFPTSFLTEFVLGIINGQFSRCLPFIIEKILVFGILYGGAWFLAFSAQGNRGEGWRSAVESITGHVPGLRSALKSLTVARLAMALNALLSAGVPVIRAWELASSACGSPHLKREISKWTPALEASTTPAEMVAQIPYFPEMFAQLYQTGEVSGKQDETLSHLHAYFEEEGFRKLRTFCVILMLVIYFTVAILVGYFVIHFYMQYFNEALKSF
jgi:type II secretory pathway component PulF